MTSKQLPERPNLEQLKNQAKSLLRSARAKEPAALERFRVLPALASLPLDRLLAMEFALHQAQSVIAREYGFKSWRELHEQVEEQSLSFAAAVDQFVRCATGAAKDRAFRLLARYPAIAHASLHTELVLGDSEAVSGRLQEHPELATQTGGVQNWEPLLYVCHTFLSHEAPQRAAGLVAIARTLLARGANPNAEYHWNWHRELPRTALWGALCAVNHLPLAEALLERGANPTDGVSMHITAGSGNLPALELLHRFGGNLNGIPGGVPPLRYILGWAKNTAGIRWLLEHGADPNLPWTEPGDAPLHIAAQRWDVPLVELLVRHGADIHQPNRDGRTAYTVAALHGNHEIAEWLRAHGAKDELSPLENFVSACTRGDQARAVEMLRANPGLRGELRREHHLMMHVPAERGDVAALETMLTCGFDPNAKDNESVTPLHRAAMAGRTEAVRLLLAHGASVKALDGMFAATPLVWATEGWTHGSHGDGADHVRAARLLIAAGSPLEWNPPEKAPDPEGTQEQLAALCREAAALPA
ncbi:MAG TPA: ankyrin repeat domain-containing protein [Candidatus Acidoferrum sp.]|jgi:ankyrin repeat protein|nr:ankyrin repeat domain-containing protein [Candidatus Acidoferrum sp.]